MVNFGETTSSSDRKAALDELKASLVPPKTDSDVLIDLSVNPDHDRYFEVYNKLFLPVILDKDTFINNPYSPTPGDPERVYIGDAPYGQTAERYMYDKIKAAQKYLHKFSASPSGILTEEELSLMNSETLLQHRREIEKNTAAFDRLRSKFINDPDSISLDEAALIEKIRGVDANINEIVDLLTLHPEMDAIGVIKITCPMDYVAYVEAHSDFRSYLAALDFDNRYVVTFVGTDDQQPRPRDITGVASERIRADKTVTAEIYDTQTKLVVEAVEKTSWNLFDTSRSFGPYLPHVVDGVNELPNYTQVYVRIKRNRFNEDELREQQRQYAAQQMLIVANGKRRHVEDL